MNRSLLLAVLSLAACGSSADPNLCLGSTCVAVATSTYNADFTGMGTLDTVNLSSREARLGVDATLDPDVAMRIVGSELFVLQRTTGSLRIYDPKTFVIKTELPLGDADHPGAMSFPQDFAVLDSGQIYVTLAGNDAAHSLVIVDRNQPGVLSYLTLPQDPADTDGKPEPNRIYSCDGKLYVTLQSYSFDSNFKIAYAKGRIAVIDPALVAVGSFITLAGENPYDIVPVGGGCSDVVVATSAGLTTVPDGKGNLERIDLSNGLSKGVLIDDLALGGRPTLLARGGDDLLYVAIYFDPQPNAMGDILLSSVKVLAFNPQTKAIRNDVSGKMGNVNFLRVHDDTLFFGAGRFANMELPGFAPRGLYMGPADGTMVSASPIDLQLTPSAIAFP